MTQTGLSIVVSSRSWRVRLRPSLRRLPSNPQPHIHWPGRAALAALAIASFIPAMLSWGGVQQSTATGSNTVAEKWLCGSTKPGTSVRPARGTTSVPSETIADISAVAPTAPIFPSFTPTASARPSEGLTVMTFPPRKTRSICSLPPAGSQGCERSQPLRPRYSMNFVGVTRIVADSPPPDRRPKYFSAISSPRYATAIRSMSSEDCVASNRAVPRIITA